MHPMLLQQVQMNVLLFLVDNNFAISSAPFDLDETCLHL